MVDTKIILAVVAAVAVVAVGGGAFLVMNHDGGNSDSSDNGGQETVEQIKLALIDNLEYKKGLKIVQEKTVNGTVDSKTTSTLASVTTDKTFGTTTYQFNIEKWLKSSGNTTSSVMRYGDDSVQEILGGTKSTIRGDDGSEPKTYEKVVTTSIGKFTAYVVEVNTRANAMTGEPGYHITTYYYLSGEYYYPIKSVSVQNETNNEYVTEITSIVPASA